MVPPDKGALYSLLRLGTVLEALGLQLPDLRLRAP